MIRMYPRSRLISNNNKRPKTVIENPLDVNTINENDIIEQYEDYKRTNGREFTIGVNKYLVTKKIVTEYSGVFFDLLDLNDTNEKPVIIKGVSLRSYKVRKYFNAEQI